MNYRLPFSFRPLTDIRRRVRRLFLCSVILSLMTLAALLVRLASAPMVSDFDLAGMVLLVTGVMLLSVGLLGCLRYITYNAGPRVERVIFRDEASGLYAPRYLLERLQEEISRAYRHSTSFSVLYLYVPGLEPYDPMGEDRPSPTVKELAQRLRSVLRKEDIPVRWSADAFVVFLPNTEFLSGYLLAERLEQGMKNVFARGPGSEITACNISIGCSTFPFDAGDVMGLIRHAEEAARRSHALDNELGPTIDRSSLRGLRGF